MPEVLEPERGGEEREDRILTAAARSQEFQQYASHFGSDIEWGRVTQFRDAKPDRSVVTFRLDNDEKDTRIEVNLTLLNAAESVVSSRATVERQEGNEIVSVDTYRLDGGEVRLNESESI